MTTTLGDALTRLAQGMESLRPADAQPAWAEIIGAFEHPERVRWHPDLDTLIGFVAPPECRAIAAVGAGWGRSLEDPPDGAGGGRPQPRAGGGVRLINPGERRRVRVVCLLTRTGDGAGYVRAGPTILIDEPPTVGRVPDCMRRCFGLPTAPPDEPSDGLMARIWLHNVRGSGEGASTALTWAAVTRLHPAMQVAAEAGLALPPSQVMGALRVAGEAWTWSYVAEQARSPGWLADLLPPGTAAWMDEGIMSRWLLASFPPVEDGLDRVKALVTPAAAKKLRSTLGQLGVLGAHHAWLCRE